MGFSQLARITKALSHPVRLQIAEILSKQEACVCHLEHALGQRQAYVSQQLGVLKNAGILRERREGTFIYYRLSDPAISEALESLRKVSGLPSNPLQTLEVTGNCPCPPCKSDLGLPG
jgi:DNA-binding transcriptional ArsR family regulator